MPESNPPPPDPPGKTIAVTGATGFIGRVVTRQLRAAGLNVRALTRRSDAAKELAGDGAVPVFGRLGDPDALRELTADACAVVHCAGAIRGARYCDFEAVNVRGTQTLIDALERPDVAFLALSSLAATKPMISDYARSKRIMERVLEASGLTCWTALRPPPVYGPGDRALGAFFGALARGVAPMPASAEARVSLIYVADLASAVVAWVLAVLSPTVPPSGRYALHDGKKGGYSWHDIIETAEQLRGRPIRRLPISPRLLSPVARLNRAAGQRLGYAPMLTPAKLRELRYPNWVCDNASIQSAIHWQPTIRLLDGLSRTRRWQ